VALHFRSVGNSKFTHRKSLALSLPRGKSQSRFDIEAIDALYALTYDAARGFFSTRE
jgi:hypothetical protein